MMSTPEPEEWGADRAPWIVVDTDGTSFRCKRCGGSDPFTVPVSLMDWVRHSQEFIEAHRHCKRPVVEVKQETML